MSFVRLGTRSCRRKYLLLIYRVAPRTKTVQTQPPSSREQEMQEGFCPNRRAAPRRNYVHYMYSATVHSTHRPLLLAPNLIILIIPRVPAVLSLRFFFVSLRRPSDANNYHPLSINPLSVFFTQHSWKIIKFLDFHQFMALSEQLEKLSGIRKIDSFVN